MTNFITGSLVALMLFAASVRIFADDIIVAENFDKDDGKYGTWNRFPDDAAHLCTLSFISPGCDGKGRCIKLSYSIDCPNGAYNGFYLKLFRGAGIDLRGYSKLVFWIKGDKEAGYTHRIKVELKNTDESSKMYVEGLKDDWNMLELKLRNFSTIRNWSKITEFVVTFNGHCTDQSGAIYLDNISFSK